MTTTAYIIFTDLDGTLLDHNTYRSDAAIPMLDKLGRFGIPVIPNTSKTFAEVSTLCQSLALNGPVIIENGAAIYVPTSQCALLDVPVENTDQAYQRIAFTRPHAYWLSILSALKQEFTGEFKSFAELGIAGIVEHTGLSESQAAAAAQREFGEPVVWLGTPQRKSLFIDALQNRGAEPVEGGRFLHVCGNCNKGSALAWLTERYQRTRFAGKLLKSIALGDGKNDIAMLEVADYAVRIKSPVHAPPTLQRAQHLITTQRCGPEGWHDALTQLIPFEQLES
ncbi:HAD-IIB family hydrolase [Alteromonas sp. SM 2104]|nr:HAD-IIB family hydrolase [Alteromonas oceanisediminis]